ncbi:MAG: hypothetical protein KF870_17445 [Leadbetterella sp.]|nr:hypothetical protein [Leadbetterella sp.]
MSPVKLLPLFTLILLLLSCRKDVDSVSSSITVGNKKFNVNHAYYFDVGIDDGEYIKSFYLTDKPLYGFDDPNFYITIETRTVGDSFKGGYFSQSYKAPQYAILTIGDEDESEVFMDTGDIEITGSKSNYTIEFEGELTDGRSIQGKIKGGFEKGPGFEVPFAKGETIIVKN